jgi:hypothetical protein
MKMKNLNQLDMKTLEACKKDLHLWKNDIYKVEIDQQNEQIKVISKRKAMNGKGFIVPLYKELTEIENNLLEKYIFSKYTTQIYLYC